MYTVAEGSRAEVFHGTAKHTPGGLVKKDLIQDKYGNIKSKAAVAAAKKRMKTEGVSAMVNLLIYLMQENILVQNLIPRRYSMEEVVNGNHQ